MQVKHEKFDKIWKKRKKSEKQKIYIKLRIIFVEKDIIAMYQYFRRKKQ